MTSRVFTRVLLRSCASRVFYPDDVAVAFGDERLNVVPENVSRRRGNGARVTRTATFVARRSHLLRGTDVKRERPFLRVPTHVDAVAHAAGVVLGAHPYRLVSCRNPASPRRRASWSKRSSLPPMPPRRRSRRHSKSRWRTVRRPCPSISSISSWRRTWRRRHACA